MAKKLVSELSGAELDYWVAMAEGLKAKISRGQCLFIPEKTEVPYAPSSTPAQGWPIIEREKISICPYYHDGDTVGWYALPKYGDHYAENKQRGETSLIAAMRCRVVSVYGGTVSDDNE